MLTHHGLRRTDAVVAVVVPAAWGALGGDAMTPTSMADEHLVMVHRPAHAGDRPDLALLERVLHARSTASDEEPGHAHEL